VTDLDHWRCVGMGAEVGRVECVRRHRNVQVWRVDKISNTHHQATQSARLISCAWCEVRRLTRCGGVDAAEVENVLNG
jgi:hypothetical protein